MCGSLSKQSDHMKLLQIALLAPELWSGQNTLEICQFNDLQTWTSCSMQLLCP